MKSSQVPKTSPVDTSPSRLTEPPQNTPPSSRQQPEELSSQPSLSPPARSQEDISAAGRFSRSLPVTPPQGGHKRKTSPISLSLRDEQRGFPPKSSPVGSSPGVVASTLLGEDFGGPLHVEGGASKNIDKVISLQILKNNPDVFPTLPNTLFSFDLDCVLQPEKSLDSDIVREITRILSDEHSNYGILLTSDGKADDDLAVVKKMIALCVDQLKQENQGDKKITRLVERIKLAVEGGAAIVDFGYKGEITHFANKLYREIKEKPGTAEIRLDAASDAPPQIVLLHNGLKKENRENSYLRAADVVLGKSESDTNVNLVQDLRQATTEPLSLAINPQGIAYRLKNDPGFSDAYCAFIDDLVRMGNGIIKLKQPEALQSQNASDLANQDAADKEWNNHDMSYSTILGKLPSKENSALAIEHPAPSEREGAKVNGPRAWVSATVDALLKEMEAASEKPLYWTINGNNHFPTHQGLKPILKRIAAKRRELNQEKNCTVKDIILISGNVPRKAPYNPGPLGKFVSPNTGKIRGKQSEAEVIHQFLSEDKDIADGYDFILETESDSTMKNLEHTLKELEKRGLRYADAICVNSQSGFSGLRSALTPFGWQAKGKIPESLYFINPDWSSATATDDERRSSKAIGETLVQAVRELKNLTGCFSKRIFIPSVPLPKNIVENFKICLQKIDIDPDMLSGSKVEDLLDQMNAIVMRGNRQKLIGSGENYATATAGYVGRDEALRRQENLVREYATRWRNHRKDKE